MNCSRATAAVTLALAMALSFSPSAMAQVWDGGGGDDNFNTAANWNPNTVPVNNGTADLVFGGTTRLGPKVNVNFDVDSITFNNTAGPFDIDQLNNSTLTVRGGGIVSNDGDRQDFFVPVDFATGSSVTATSGTIGFKDINLGSNTVTVSGAGTTAMEIIRGTGSIIKNGDGTLDISPNFSQQQSYQFDLTINSGSVNSVGSLDFDSNAAIAIDGGTLFANSGLFLSGQMTRSNTGTFTLGANTQFFVFDGAVTFNGSYATAMGGRYDFFGANAKLTTGDFTLNQDATLSVSGGANATFTGDLKVGVNGTAGTLTVDGGTLMNTATDGQSRSIGEGNGSVGTVTFRNFAQGNFRTSSVLLGLLGTGTLAVESGSQVSADSFFVAATGFSGTGTVTVTGPGSKLMTASPFGSISIGSELGGIGMVNVENGGELDLGGFLSINKTGTLNINGGIVTMDEGRTITNHGTLNFNSGRLNLGTDLSIGGFVGGPLGVNVELSTGRHISVPAANATFVGSPGSLVIDGGSLATGSLVNFGGTIDFRSGTLTLTGSEPFSVASAGPLGRIVTLDEGAKLSVTAAPTGVSADGVLTVNGGDLSLQTFTNNGSVIIREGAASIGGGSNGSGALVYVARNLQISGPFINQPGGRIELADGAGRITGNGEISNHGLVTGSGMVALALDNFADGEIRAEDAKRLEIRDANFVNNGRLSLLGGTLQFSQTLTNTPTGLISGRGTLIVGNGSAPGLTNNGNAGFSAGFTDIYGDVVNASAGKMVISGGGVLTFYDDLTNNGEVRTAASARTVLFGGLSGNGPFTGTGTVQIEGDLTPGMSPAIINFAGDVEFGSAATLEVELGGLTPGVQYDQINIGGQATLNGTLDIELFNGFSPSIGQQFQIMTFGSRIGMFPTITGTTISPTVELQPIYTATDLKLVAVAGGEKTWGVDAGGQASVGPNWFGGAPPASPNDSAAFTTVITADRTVTVDVPLNLRSIRFDDDNSYTIAGPQVVTLSALSPAAATIRVENAHGNGAHTIAAPLVVATNLSIAQDSSQPLTIGGPLDNSAGRTITTSGTGAVIISGAQTHGVGSSIDVNAGSLTLNTNAGTNAARNATINANSTTNFGATQHLAALNVGAAATVTITPGGPKNVVTNALSIAGGSTPAGKLDLTDNAAILDYPAVGPSPEVTIRAQIIAGRGGSGLGKTWNGQGITSSTAGGAPPNSRSVGYAVNGTLPLLVYSNFRGQPVDATTILMRFTRTGDANLDGIVNTDDVAVVGANYAPLFPKPRWDLGDFDYNGFVDNDDITLLGAFFNPGAPAIPTPEVGGVVPIPEPSAWAFAAAAICLLPVLFNRRPSKWSSPPDNHG